jgi:hypothetical protein
MDVDSSGWSGDGDFTARLIAAVSALPHVVSIKVEDAPASRADAGFSFISNELFVGFEHEVRRDRRWQWGFVPRTVSSVRKRLTLSSLEAALTALPDIGAPDYADAGMLQYLRTDRIIPPYQSKPYKLIELVRVYEAGSAPRRD